MMLQEKSMKSVKNSILILSILVSAQLIGMEQPPQGPEKPKINLPTGESFERSIFSDRYPRAATLSVLGSFLVLKGVQRWSPNLNPRMAATLRQGANAAFGGITAVYFVSPYLFPRRELGPQSDAVVDAVKAMKATGKFQKEIEEILKQQEKK